MKKIALVLGFCLAGISPVSAIITNRWSFNNASGAAAPGLTLMDSIGGATATVVGVNASFTGTALTLPGSSPNNSNQPANTIPAYIDLPNGIISSKTHLTVEIWATAVSMQNNQRLFEFGRVNTAGVGGGAPGEITNNSTTSTGSTSASDGINLNISRGTSASALNAQRLEGRLNGATPIQGDTGLLTTAGAEHHYVVTYEAGVGAFAATGGRLTWYRDTVFIRSIDLNYRLSSLEDVNNWLGRSQGSNDWTSNIRYNEVRLYDEALTQLEINTSFAQGANPATPVAQADAITLNHGAKVTVPVLANDTGGLLATIVQGPQSGTAVVDELNRIRYVHTTGSPASDTITYQAVNAAGQSANATLTLTFSPNLRLAAPTVNVPSSPPPTSYQLVDAFPITFTDPTTLATPPGETSRLFVCQKGGLLRVIPNTNVATPTASTFLDLSALLTSRGETLSTSSENGLLGVAFHPSYASNRFFYLFYTPTRSGITYNRVSRFTAQAGNPNAADPASEFVLLEQLDEVNNHNGGDLHFGPDGYLYISTGDEGDQNDARNNSQRITKDLFCAILRIDVDKRPGNMEPNANPDPVDYPSSPPPDAVIRDSGIARYSIPIDNPYVHTSLGGNWNGSFNGAAIPAGELPFVRSEIWASGLRNPWRMSFDSVSGDLWVGDVGGGQREEINIITRGGNYGWALREGFVNGPKSAQAPANFDTLFGTRPIHDYTRGSGPTQGNSITGGIVYRGSRFPALVGSYIYADYVSGNIWSIRRSGANGATTPVRLTGEGGIVAFGRDPSNGDVLLANLSSDRIRRLIGGVPASGYPATLSETGVFADLVDLSPNPGVVSYSVNLPFWSDFAEKRRWFTVPALSGTMTWSRDSEWSFPAGQVWIKHFDMDLTRGDPATRRRLETRLLVRNADGAYGVSYRWNDAGTEATLVPEEGVEFDLNVVENGTPRVQRWSIPSRASCLTCHTPQGGHALSSNTRQFNLTGTMNGFAGNQLTLLQNAGYFANAVESPNVLPRHLRPTETAFPVEARVRSYLAVNCAYCHKAGGTGGTSPWDGRPELTLDQTVLINTPAANNGGNPDNRLIVPGSTLHSIIYNRTGAFNGFTRMPPLATSELDQPALTLLESWINAALPSRQSYADWRLANFGNTTSLEGAPEEDADADGAINQSEYLAGTDPRKGTTFLNPQLNNNGTQASLTFSLPPNRSAVIETSTDLMTWTPWDIPGNHGLPTQGGAITLSGPVSGPQQFFRVRISAR
jgi:glucose/arabinose dehydrogenase